MATLSEPVGRVLGNRYRLLATLGTGAHAHVFLAEDLVLQRRVAVKVLQPALVRDETFLRRFRAEARSVAAMNHPHVLRVFDWGEDDDGPYLVLEYLEGGSLFDMLARGHRLSAAQAARVGMQAADGLAYAHVRGIVHRDVKPANILFDEEGRVRVADFGVARALAGSALTEPVGVMIGTARYASPEQAEGRPLDGRSDVYSLGLVLYEAMTGEVPFVRDTPVATLMARVDAPLPHHPALGVLDDILASACASDPEVRPDAARLAVRLEALSGVIAPPAPLPLVRREPVGARGPGPLGQTAPPADVEGLTDAVPYPPPFPGAGQGTGGTTGVIPALGGYPGRLGGPGAPTSALTAGSPYNGTLAEGAPYQARRRRRRRRWILAVVVLVLVLVAGGLVYAFEEKAFTPSHSMPSLVGRTVVSAKRTLTADHFAVDLRAAEHSITVPAGSVLHQNPRPGTSLKQGSTVILIPSSGKPNVSVPLLSGGVTCSAATGLLAENHLKANCPALLAYTNTVPSGEIINWSYGNQLDPSTAPYGSTINCAVSQGKPPVKITNYVGQPFTQAQAAIKQLGLGVKETQAYSTTVPTGQVISTNPATGATAPAGSTVTVTVSKGPHLVTVPNVTGKTVQAATSALEKVGLTVGPIYGPATGKVFTTVPLAQQQAKVGSAVTLYTQ